MEKTIAQQVRKLVSKQEKLNNETIILQRIKTLSEKHRFSVKFTTLDEYPESFEIRKLEKELMLQFIESLITFKQQRIEEITKEIEKL